MQLTFPVYAVWLCIVQGGFSKIAGRAAQAARRFAPGKHPNTKCIPWLLTMKYIAVDASVTCMSVLQLRNKQDLQEEARNMHLLFEHMHQKVGLLTLSFI